MDQRKDERIDFVGGIRGLGELEKRVDSGEMAIAFALYPVSMNELLEVADAGKIMPQSLLGLSLNCVDYLFMNFLKNIIFLQEKLTLQISNRS